ncbi:MAG: hypothetical protein ACRDZ7_11580 [Acidimicrobiia bacterium]
MADLVGERAGESVRVVPAADLTAGQAVVLAGVVGRIEVGPRDDVEADLDDVEMDVRSLDALELLQQGDGDGSTRVGIDRRGSP